MKIKNNRVIKCVTCLVTCFMLVVAGMATPARAYELLKPSAHLVEVTADGNTKTAHYNFDELHWTITAWDNKSNTYTDYYDWVDYEFYTANNVVFQCFPFGGPVNGELDLQWNSVAFDVSDILPGSPIAFKIPFVYNIGWKSPGVLSGTLYYTVSVKYYDASGCYMGTVDGETHADTFRTGDDGVMLNWYENKVCEGEFPANACYVVPVLKLQTILDSDDSVAIVSFGGSHVDLYIDINTVIENSNMMHSINNKLDAVGDKLDDTNNKLDDTNDKLDGIISGGQAGEDLDHAVGSLDNKNDELSGTMEDYDNAFNKLPTTPNADHFESIVDQQGIDNAIDEANKVFDWDASGLTYMFPPMAISLSLAVLFYVVFGKG